MIQDLDLEFGKKHSGFRPSDEVNCLALRQADEGSCLALTQTDEGNCLALTQTDNGNCPGFRSWYDRDYRPL